MKRLVLALAAVVVASGSYLSVHTARSARAEDAAPAGMPPSQKKIDCPLAKALVGDWTIATAMMGQTGTAKSKIALALGDTAIFEDYTGSFMGMSFVGHGVYKVSDDGKTINGWWFDTMASEPMKLTGPLTETGYEISGSSDRGPVKITMKKVEGGFDFAMSEGGQPSFTQQYRKAK
jgi:hypothetical protein